MIHSYSKTITSSWKYLLKYLSILVTGDFQFNWTPQVIHLNGTVKQQEQKKKKKEPVYKIRRFQSPQLAEISRFSPLITHQTRLYPTHSIKRLIFFLKLEWLSLRLLFSLAITAKWSWMLQLDNLASCVAHVRNLTL